MANLETPTFVKILNRITVAFIVSAAGSKEDPIGYLEVLKVPSIIK